MGAGAGSMQTVHQVNEFAKAAAADLPAADFKVGHIISVTGSKVTATLVSTGPDAGSARQLNKAVQIGSLVKLPTGESIAFGIVSTLSTGNPSPSPELGEQWVVEIDLFGDRKSTRLNSSHSYASRMPYSA